MNWPEMIAAASTAMMVGALAWLNGYHYGGKAMRQKLASGLRFSAELRRSVLHPDPVQERIANVLLAHAERWDGRRTHADEPETEGPA